MAYNDVEILRDKNGNPIPQYYNVATGQFEPLTGENGATHTQLTRRVVEKQPVDNVTVTAGSTSLITFRPERTIKAYSVLLKADAPHPKKFRLVEFFGNFSSGDGTWFEGISWSGSDGIGMRFPKQDVVGAAGWYRVEITNDDDVDHEYNVYFTEWGL